MIYLLVLISSAAGIALLFLVRSVLRSRNARRIVHAVRRGLSSFHEKSVKHLPESTAPRKPRARASAIHRQQVRILLHDAERALGRQDAATAERALIRALTLEPKAVDVTVRLARLYLDTSRLPKAEALYRELLQERSDPSIFANLGLACYKQRKFSEAYEAYAEALRLSPKDPQRMADLGRAAMALQHFEEAAPLFEQALLLTPRDKELLHLLAQCYSHLQEFTKAEEVYRRIKAFSVPSL